MKLYLFLRYCLIIIIFSLLVLPSCKKRKDVCVESATYLFENQTDNESYFVKVDSVDGYHIEGKYYLLGKELVVDDESFEIEFSRRKSQMVFSDSVVIKYKVKKRLSGNYIGWFHIDGDAGKKQFVLSPYKADDYHVFKNRYKDEIFEVERIADVNYAKVKGFWSSIPDDTIDVAHVVKTGLFKSLKKKYLDLDMDIYIPKNDTLSKRPLLMLIHGGAFFIGDKATSAYQKWCTHFASIGYVCVSINYRMGFRINSKAIERTAYQATQDAHAAMRYLVSKQDIYRIDTDNLFVGGASAGSITAMNLAFMRNKDRPESSYSSLFMEDLGDLETSGNKIINDFKIKAVANMWGTIYDLNILKNSNASIISFHGDEDVILPYGFGYPFRAIGEFQKVFFDKMYGSSYIHKKALDLGIRSELHTFKGQGHALHLDENRNLNHNFYKIQDEITDFFYDELIPYPVDIVQDENDVQIFTIDTADVLKSDWSIVGGFIKEESKGKVRALWFDDDTKQELRVSGYYRNGAGFEDVLKINYTK